MKVRYQADYDLNQEIVRILHHREPMIDFQTAHKAGLEGVDDDIVLAIAAKEGRVPVSHDRKTMPLHFAKFISNQTSPGLILITQGLPPVIAVEELLLIWVASTPEEYVNRMVSIPM
jgi:hypothetical protein